MDYDSDEYLQLDLKRIDVFLLMQRNSKQCCIVSSCVVYAKKTDTRTGYLCIGHIAHWLTGDHSPLPAGFRLALFEGM